MNIIFKLPINDEYGIYSGATLGYEIRSFNVLYNGDLRIFLKDSVDELGLTTNLVYMQITFYKDSQKWWLNPTFTPNKSIEVTILYLPDYFNTLLN